MREIIRRALLASKPQSYSRRVISIRPGNMTGAWPLWEASGRTAANSAAKTVNINCFDNGGFETAGAGGADIWALTQEVVSDGALADEVVLVHEGGSAHAAKITAGVNRNTYIRLSQNGAPNTNTLNAAPGTAMTLTFWTRGDGTNPGRYTVYDFTNSTAIVTNASTGVAGEVYTQVTYTFAVPATCYELQIVFVCPNVNGGIAYFDDASLTCNYPLIGKYSTTGTTLGVTGIGDRRTAIRVDGTDNGILIGNKAFGSVWDGNIGSAVVWGRVDDWTNIVAIRYMFHAKARQDGTVYLVMGRSQDNPNQLMWRRRITGVIYEQKYAWVTPPTTWFCMGFTWDVTSAPKRCAGYVYAPNNILAFTKVFDEAPAAGNEAWVNATYTCDDQNTILAAGSLTAQEWIGDMAYCYYWAGVALTDAEMNSAMVP